jgi:hypothetical protein
VATVLRYPLRAPVSGSNFLEGPDAPTGRVDFLKIQRFRIDYSKNPTGYGGTNLPSNEVAVKLDSDVCYLAMPQQLSTTYNASYNQIDMGAMGVFATRLVGQGMNAAGGSGSISGESVKNQLKSAVAAALPEMAFNKGAQLIGSLTQGLDVTNGATSGATLSALSGGRIMNPFTEQVFNGVSFRNHSFALKMFARNKSEAQEILRIIRYLKVGTLPKFGDADIKSLEQAANNIIAGASTALGGSAPPPISLPSGSQTGAYLEVPDRFLLEFVRLDPASDTIVKIPHYKFQPCVCTNLSVNYTPDGQYVSFKDAIADLVDSGDTGPSQMFVPAVEISLEFAETRILTQRDGVAGF